MTSPVIAQTRMIVNTLSQEEASALYLAVALNYQSISGVKGYEKIKTLLTEEKGTQMHSVTRDAFLGLVAEKL